MHTESTHRQDMSKSEPETNTAPAGWRLVPVEPTESMIEAARDVKRQRLLKAVNEAKTGKQPDTIGMAMACGEEWSAMLSAAPQPPAAQQGEAVAPADLRERIAAAKEAVDDGDASSCASILRETLRVLDAQPAAAPQPVAQGDPMDWPLPCDVKVGHGTMRKGVPLRTLVARMKVLYEMATGENADKVAGITMDERQARMDEFRAALAAAPAGVVGEPVAEIVSSGPADMPILRWLSADHSFRAPIGSKLYPAPPARQALTLDQISEMEWGAECLGMTWGMRVAAVRAVERSQVAASKEQP